MPEFQPIRYLKRWYGLAIAAAVLVTAFVFCYAAHAQRYVAVAIMEYTGDAADRGQNPDGSALDPPEMFSAARADELARTLGLQDSVQELRNGFAAEPMVLGLHGEWLAVNSAAGQQLLKEYGLAGRRTAYRITYTANGSKGGAYASDVLRALLAGYAAWYGEHHVLLEPAVLPGGVCDTLAEDGEYIDCADGLIAAAQESMAALQSRAERYPAFRSAATGYAPADLAAEYAYVLDEELTKLRSDIWANGAARNREGLLARWNAELTGFRADLELARGRAEQIKALMAQMDASSAQAQISEPVLVQEGQAASAAAYDVLAERYAQALTDMIGRAAELRACEERIVRFPKAGADDVDVRRIEDGIAEAAGRLKNLHALALGTDAELRARIAADCLTLREGVTVRGTVDVWLYTLLGAALGGLLGVLLAIFVGRINEILRTEDRD